MIERSQPSARKSVDLLVRQSGAAAKLLSVLDDNCLKER